MKKITISVILSGVLLPFAGTAHAALTAMSSVIQQGANGNIGSYFIDSPLTVADSYGSGNIALPGATMNIGSAFSITLNFDATVTPQQQAIFNQAKATWQSLIPAYRTGVTGPTALVINASIPLIDGPGLILGSAGPTVAGTSGGFLIAAEGDMEFDSADVANLISAGTFDEVILHEMGHVLGLGTLWTNNNVYVNGTGQYTGAAGLAAFKTEWVGQAGATFVPVELGGGGGTANGHWNEVDNGAGLTGLVRVADGKDMQFELMTGWLNTAQPTYISNMTLGSLVDLGYNAVPEPSGILLSLIAFGTLVRRRRRNLV